MEQLNTTPQPLAEKWSETLAAAPPFSGGQVNLSNILEFPEDIEMANPPEEQLSEYFASEKFANEFKKCTLTEKERMVQGFLDYTTILGNYETALDFDSCLSEMSELRKTGSLGKPDCLEYDDQTTAFLIEAVSDKLGITPSDPDYERTIFEYFNRKLMIDGPVFHAFNGAFTESVLQNGLSSKGQESVMSECQQLHDEVFKDKYGIHPFLYLAIDAKQDRAKNVFFDGEPDHVYRYAATSPEWFNTFVHSFSWENGTAFIRRDYDTAYNSINSWCDKEKVSDSQREKVVGFFEKYWKMFATDDQPPKVALIPRKAIGAERPLHYDICKKIQAEFPDEKPFLEVYVDMMLHHFRENNCSYDGEIAPDQFTLVDLPKIEWSH